MSVADDGYSMQVSDRYDDMIVVVRANSADELAVDYTEAMVTLRTTRDDLFGKPDQAQHANAVGQVKRGLGGKVISDGPTCPHGAMVHRTSKQGASKKWQGYFCPSKSKGCEVVWKDQDNEDEPWWT